jgi:hypothetical protein
MAENNNGGTSIFVPGLTILFIGLKLTGHVDWPWWWVLSPIWIVFAVLLGGLVLWLLAKGSWECFKVVRDWRRRKQDIGM